LSEQLGGESMKTDAWSPSRSAGDEFTAPQGRIESPALAVERGQGDPYELKFRLTEAESHTIEAWARQRLRPDPHGHDGVYATTSVYCDTAGLDVYRRSDGHRRSKFRLRRYGTSAMVFLERKTKKGDRVRKRRAAVSPDELALLASLAEAPGWAAEWFLQRVRTRRLRPVCRVGYERTAFVGTTSEGAVRLTMDRGLAGVPASGWEPAALEDARPLLPGSILVELKFHDALPLLFKELLPLLPASPARVSKYRLCVDAWGLAPGGA
jgi:hypothetical protein